MAMRLHTPSRWVRTHKKRALLLSVVALVAISGGIYSLIRYAGTDNRQDTGRKAEVITTTTDNPSESKPAASAYAWRGDKADPKKIIIPAAGVDAFIQNMGVDQHKEVAAPSNIHLAGWFVNSVRPGQRGLSIIDGHVNGRTDKNAVFANLAKLRQGDTFSVVKGDDSVLEYTVMSTQTIELAKVPDVLYSQDPKVSSQLNLITCGGTFDRGTREYASRTVVTAALQKNDKND